MRLDQTATCLQSPPPHCPTLQTSRLVYLAAQLMPPPNALRNISEVSNISGEYYYCQLTHLGKSMGVNRAPNSTPAQNKTTRGIYLNPVLLPHGSHQKI